MGWGCCTQSKVRCNACFCLSFWYMWCFPFQRLDMQGGAPNARECKSGIGDVARWVRYQDPGGWQRWGAWNVASHWDLNASVCMAGPLTL